MEPVPFRPRDGRISGWKVAIPGNRPLATPAIAEGRLYLGGGFGSHEFYAFDAISGRRVWTYRTADDGPTAAVVEGGLIAFNTESCELEILTTGGRPLWKKWLGDPLMSMPAMADGRVYMAFPDSRGRGTYYLAAFELRDGAEIWRSPLPGEIITAPVVDRDRIYVSTVGGLMLALNRRDGSRIWEEARNATSAPAIWNERAFFSRREASQAPQGASTVPQQTEVLASKATAAADSPVNDAPATKRKADYLDYSKRAQGAAEQQSQAYDAAVGFGGLNKGSAAMAPAQANLGQASVHGIWSYQGSKPFVVNGRLYSSMGDTAECVDAPSGRVLWSRNLRDVRRPGYTDDILTPPAVVNGKVFVGTRWGFVYALSAETGEVIWRVDIGEPVSFQPAVAMGRVYVGTDRGSIFCLETGDPRDDGWMMWGGNAKHNGR
jgi:outer membrane protein assembly factor BamB